MSTLPCVLNDRQYLQIYLLDLGDWVRPNRVCGRRFCPGLFDSTVLRWVVLSEWGGGARQTDNRASWGDGMSLLLRRRRQQMDCAQAKLKLRASVPASRHS